MVPDIVHFPDTASYNSVLSRTTTSFNPFRLQTTSSAAPSITKTFPFVNKHDARLNCGTFILPVLDHSKWKKFYGFFSRIIHFEIIFDSFLKHHF
jgi:hypothetical protein